MATIDTHRAQAKSLHKRGLLTDKQHERMLARLDAMPVEAAPNLPNAQAAAPAMAGTQPATGSMGNGAMPMSATPPGAPNP